MAEVSKVNPQGSAQPRIFAQAGGILGRIRPVGDQAKGVKMVVYGSTKRGKTRFACTFPKPLLLLGTEDGTQSVQGDEGIHFAMLHSSAEVDEVVQAFKWDKNALPFKSVVLDTAGGLESLILREVLGLDELPVQRSFGMAQREHWGAVAAQFKDRAKKLLNLAQAGMGVHVVVIAHERSFAEEGAPADGIAPHVGPALTPKTAGWLNGEADYIGQCYIRDEEVDKDEMMDDGTKVRMRVKTGKKEYCLRLGPSGTYMTGARVPRGVVLPDSIVWPDYEKLAALINWRPGQRTAGKAAESRAVPQVGQAVSKIKATQSPGK